MSEQNENHDQAAEALWNRRPAPTAASAPESAPSPASAPAQPKVPLAQRIKGIHLVFVGAIVGVGYIWGWPWLDNYLNQGQVAPARLQVDSALTQQPPAAIPAAAPMTHPQMASHPAQEASAPAAQTLNPGTGLNAAQPASAPAAAVAGNTVPSAHEQELLDQIKLLKQQLSAAGTCTSPHPAATAKQTTAFAAAGAGSNSGDTSHRRHKKATKRSAATALASAPAAGQAPARKSEGRLAGFEVNTVYKDQAYVRHGDSTYIVQVGDTIEGVQILAIDADQRRVITPVGVIEGR